MMNNKKYIGVLAIFLLLAVALWHLHGKQPSPQSENTIVNSITFERNGLTTNIEKSIIPLEEVLGGGPAKDGIPAISNPTFTNISEAPEIPDETLGIFIAGKNESRFYPYTILVWHEIINDNIDGVPIVISFCPLCGSAITYERELNGAVYEFGVSGKLWQSNLLMYDKTTESLWSQIEGRAVAGDLSGSELTLFPSQVITYKNAKNLDNELYILSSDTGYQRDYTFYPYGDYEDTERLIFPVNNLDISLPTKTLMYASSINNEPVAFHREKLLDEKSAELETDLGTITATVSESNEITITDENGNNYPGYVTMWFSWANHNNGQIWK